MARCVLTWTALLRNQVEDLNSCRTLLDELLTEGAILQELCHHQTSPKKTHQNTHGHRSVSQEFWVTPQSHMVLQNINLESDLYRSKDHSPGSDFSQQAYCSHYWAGAISCSWQGGVNGETALLW